MGSNVIARPGIIGSWNNLEISTKDMNIPEHKIIAIYIKLAKWVWVKILKTPYLVSKSKVAPLKKYAEKDMFILKKILTKNIDK